eukprot:gene3997-4352_t
MSACERAGDAQRAFQVYEQMRRAAVKANTATLNTLLKAFIKLKQDDEALHKAAEQALFRITSLESTEVPWPPWSPAPCPRSCGALSPCFTLSFANSNRLLFPPDSTAAPTAFVPPVPHMQLATRTSLEMAVALVR